MSLSLVNQRFDKLSRKEEELNQYFDVLKQTSNQHPYIKDLRDDYKDDLANYGFSKQELKKEIDE